MCGTHREVTSPHFRMNKPFGSDDNTEYSFASLWRSPSLAGKPSLLRESLAH